MPKTANIHVRMDEQIKEDALRVFEGLGLSVAEAITLYFKQVAINNTIPFELALKPAMRKGIDLVSDYKRNDLMKVLEIIPSSVDEVWVFGSAVTPYCRPDSDLDVCIVGNNITKEDRSCIAHAPRHAMDLLDITPNEFAAESLDKNSIFYQVKNNGVLVYKRGIGVING